MEQKRSFFGPLLLIAIGAVWLLVSAGTVPSSNLWALTHIWPFLLMAAGLGLILRPYWAYTSILMDIIIIGGAVAAILFAPQLGWATPIPYYTIQNGETFIGFGQAGSGNMITQTRAVSNFHEIDLEYPAQVFISQGDSESLKIEAEDNVLPGIVTQVKNGVLDVYYQADLGKRVSPRRTVTITITVKDLTDVRFSSAGALTINGLKTDGLNLSLSGAGDLKLNDISFQNLTANLSGAGSLSASGKADNLSLNVSGFGNFDGTALQDKTADINISGAGGATVWATDSLSANISGAGSINYFGSPKLTKQINGIGGVNHIGDK